MRPKPVPTTSASGYDLRPLSAAQRDQLAEKLSPEERRVLLNQGTEAPFCGTLLNNKRTASTPAGCAGCRCSRPMRSSSPAPAGRASRRRSIPITSRSW
jgi:peptide-methionine (R)-S-oxide reductase